MRPAGWLLLAAVLQQPPMSMSDLMVKILYPTADAVFYIETRTPTDEAGWTDLQHQTKMLADAAAELAAPRWARGRDQWIADARLLVDASAAAVDAAQRRDVKALADLNDALYTSCVSCHQHYRPGYGRPRRRTRRQRAPSAEQYPDGFSRASIA